MSCRNQFLTREAYCAVHRSTAKTCAGRHQQTSPPYFKLPDMLSSQVDVGGWHHILGDPRPQNHVYVQTGQIRPAASSPLGASIVLLSSDDALCGLDVQQLREYAPIEYVDIGRWRPGRPIERPGDDSILTTSHHRSRDIPNPSNYRDAPAGY